MIILALESAIAGGSISLLDDDRELDHWIGTSNVSKAEDLLFNIDAMLASNKIHRNDLGLIAVSAGPGSFTGIRIGLATALGLKAGLGIPMSSGSALQAMALSRADNEKMIAAIPMGRNAVCLQSFRKQTDNVVAFDDARTMPEDAFLSMIQRTDDRFILHSSLYENAHNVESIINFGTNIACAVGMICQTNRGSLIEPLFISKSF